MRNCTRFTSYSGCLSEKNSLAALSCCFRTTKGPDADVERQRGPHSPVVGETLTRRAVVARD